jgi:tryptophan 2,3-dioxygenase
MDNNISEDKDMNFLSHRVQISLGAEVPLGTKKQKTIEERYKKPCTYWDYILPGELIKLQKGREGKGLNHHDEHLFIIVHQTFELWFKQVLYEMDWVRETLMEMVRQGTSSPTFKIRAYESVIQEHERNALVALVAHRLHRIDKILRIATTGFDAMETMEPVDFLEFRDFLIPASGFQSVQLREIEITMGLTDNERIPLDGKSYREQFKMVPTKFSSVDENVSNAKMTEQSAHKIHQCQLSPHTATADSSQAQVNSFLALFDTRASEPSLKVALYHWLASLELPGKESLTRLFLGKKETQYNSKISQFVAKQQKAETKKQQLSRLVTDRDQTVRNEFDRLASKIKDGNLTADENLSLFVNSLLNLGFAPHIVKDKDKLLLQYGKEPMTFQFFCDVVHRLVDEENQRLTSKINKLTETIRAIEKEKEDIFSFFRSTDPILPSFTDPPKTLGASRTAALYLMTLRWSHDWTFYSDVVSAALRVEQAFLIWRQRHARMVELMIGRRRGTGGSSGVAYLDRTAQYRLLLDLWYIRAILVSRSTLPDGEFFGGNIVPPPEDDADAYQSYNLEY